MALITAISHYQDYEHEKLTPETLAELQKAADECPSYIRTKFKRALKLLECYLQITEQDFGLSSSKKNSKANQIVNGFIGALYSDDFFAASFVSRYEYATAIQAVITSSSLSESSVRSYKPIQLSYTTASPDVLIWLEFFKHLKKCPVRQQLWNGWVFKNSKGLNCVMPLFPMYSRLGLRFTHRFFDACQTYYSGRVRGTIPCLKELSKFIKHYPSSINGESFQSGRFVTQFIRDFGRYYFTTESRPKPATVQYLCNSWRGFKGLVDDCLIPQSVFAAYIGTFPLPKGGNTSGDATHVQESDFGYMKYKLLTPVPLEVTDSVAMSLLRQNIEGDYQTMRDWAVCEVEDMWARYEARNRNAVAGKVREVQEIGGCDGSGWLNNSANPMKFIHAAATFVHHGYLSNRDVALHLLYPQPLTLTADELALPKRWSLIPHCVLLIDCHPELTESMLTELPLYDKKNKLVGFEESSEGCFLTCYKGRKGPDNAQVRISLKPEAAKIVSQVIQLTSPLRAYLKDRNDPAWRLLFISSGKGFAYPRKCNFALSQAENSTFLEAVSKLSTKSAISEKYAAELLKRFSLNTWRATVGVIVFFRTNSAAAMSKALGHTRYDPKLLCRYLPTPIFAFFQDRNVRTFQIGIILHAMKGSEHIVEASGFDSVESTHTFLQSRFNSEQIFPEPNKTECESKTKHAAVGEILFSVDPAVLATLIQICNVVREGKQVSSEMRYWASVFVQLERLIERDCTRRPDIYAHLTAARQSLGT